MCAFVLRDVCKSWTSGHSPVDVRIHDICSDCLPLLHAAQIRAGTLVARSTSLRQTSSTGMLPQVAGLVVNPSRCTQHWPVHFELGLSSRAPQVSAKRVRLACSLKSRVLSSIHHDVLNIGRSTSSWDSRRALHKSPPNEFDWHAPSSRRSCRQSITMYSTLAGPLRAGTLVARSTSLRQTSSTGMLPQVAGLVVNPSRCTQHWPVHFELGLSSRASTSLRQTSSTGMLPQVAGLVVNPSRCTQHWPVHATLVVITLAFTTLVVFDDSVLNSPRVVWQLHLCLVEQRLFEQCEAGH